MLKILKYFKWHDWLGAVVVLFLTIAEVQCDLKMPEYMKSIITSAQFGMDTVWQNGLIALGYVLASIAISILVSFIASKISSGLSKRLRKAVFEKVGTFSMAEINKFSTASLITRSTNDINQVQQVVTMMLKLFLYAPIMAISAIIKITNINATLTWTTFGFIVVMFVFVGVIMLLSMRKFMLMQKQTDALNNVARENLTGIRVVRANNAEAQQVAKFTKVNDQLTQTTLYTNRVSAIMFPGMQLIMNGLNLALYWIGASLILNPEVAIDYLQISEFSQYAVQVLMSFLFVGMIFIMFPRGNISAKRILEVLNTTPSLQNGTIISTDNGVVGKVEFKNVCFKYPDAQEYVLKDISFVATSGQTVAFIGSTGSGKSTLINLVPRFYDCTQGEVLIDDENIKNYKFSALNNKLGYIPQKSLLFGGTVKENITYGKTDAPDSDIQKALQVSQSAEFVKGLNGGLDFVVAQGGKNLSGGQKQRLSIARALVKKPEILIFDDSFSALDYKTDKALRLALKQEYQNTTKLIVAQRIGTILDADKIIVLDNGEMVGCGTHSELMQTCEVYKQIALSQLSKEELENGSRQ